MLSRLALALVVMIVPASAGPAVERLRDEGPIEGLAGWAETHAADAGVCTGTRVVTRRGTRPRSEKAFIAVLDLAFPASLSFDPARREKAERSQKKFADWVDRMNITSRGATHALVDRVEASKDVPDVVAMARIAQLQHRVASLLVRAPVPRDLRTGAHRDEKTAAFCERLAEVAEPFLAAAESAVAACAAKLDDASPAWVRRVCAP